MAQASCPTPETLADYLLGKVSEADIEAVASHLDQCQACQGQLETLDSLEDSFVSKLRQPVSPADSTDQELEELLSRVEALVPAVAEKAASMDEGQPAAQAPLPEFLGQYQLLEKLGQGGMGTVYKALHTRLKRDVAVKILPVERMNEPEAVARFQREMEAVGKLKHPNIVQAHDAGESDGRHFLVMEFLDGMNLSRLVRSSGPLPVADACEAVRQAAMGLQHAHEHGLIHRDVKPSNLILTGDGILKVLDLGLARLIAETPVANDMTSTSQVMGTGDFIAPEQAEDTRQADARSDIYSLGCALYFLLAGHAPFFGPQYGSFLKKVMAHTREQIPPIRSVRSDIPEGVVTILERMVTKAPAQRLQTAAEVAELLQPYTAGSDLAALLKRQEAHPCQGPAGSPLPPSSTQNHRGLRPRFWSLLAGLVLLTLGTAVYRYGPLVVVFFGGGFPAASVGQEETSPSKVQSEGAGPQDGAMMWAEGKEPDTNGTVKGPASR
jgi:serine/threonine protein kinase